MASEILAFDPATTSAAWALLHLRGRALRFVAGGEIDRDGRELAELLERHRPDVVAVECPAKTIFDAKRGPMVMRSTRASGWFEGAAEALGYVTIVISANAWRTLLVARHNADDVRIGNAIAARVEGLPAKTSVHLRDAVGVGAVIGAWMAAGRSIDDMKREIEFAELTKREKLVRLVRRSA
jgi:Holliday junction resolvasome RuvABC endonuclease subunit